MGFVPCMENPLASPKLMEMAAEGAAAGRSLPSPESWCLPGVLHRKDWRLGWEQRLLGLSRRGEKGLPSGRSFWKCGLKLNTKKCFSQRALSKH